LGNKFWTLKPFVSTLSEEDLRILFSMTDGVANNPNQYTLKYDTGGHILPIISCSNKLYTMKNIIDIIAKEGKRLNLIEFINKTPFEEYPLHINDPEPYGLIARWRLKIGK